MNILTEDEKRSARNRNAKRHRDEQARKQYHEREHLRGEIRSREYIGVVHDAIMLLQRGQETMLDGCGMVISVELDRTRQAGLKASAELALRMLGKTMPDLKQIELRADVTQEVLPQTITYTVITPDE